MELNDDKDNLQLRSHDVSFPLPNLISDCGVEEDWPLSSFVRVTGAVLNAWALETLDEWVFWFHPGAIFSYPHFQPGVLETSVSCVTLVFCLPEEESAARNQKLTSRNRISVLQSPTQDSTLFLFFLKCCHHIKEEKKKKRNLDLLRKKDFKGQTRASVFLLSPIQTTSQNMG